MVYKFVLFILKIGIIVKWCDSEGYLKGSWNKGSEWWYFNVIGLML